MTSELSRDELRKMLRSKGLRATPARVALLGALCDASGPVSHLELASQLDSLGLDKSTVFRGLQDLTEVGLLRRLDLGDHVWRYEPIVDSGSTVDAHSDHDRVHPHMLCVECGEVRCLKEDDINIELSKDLGTVLDVLVKGHCSKCDAHEATQELPKPDQH